MLWLRCEVNIEDEVRGGVREQLSVTLWGACLMHIVEKGHVLGACNFHSRVV